MRSRILSHIGSWSIPTSDVRVARISSPFIHSGAYPAKKGYGYNQWQYTIVFIHGNSDNDFANLYKILKTCKYYRNIFYIHFCIITECMICGLQYTSVGTGAIGKDAFAAVRFDMACNYSRRTKRFTQLPLYIRGNSMRPAYRKHGIDL